MAGGDRLGHPGSDLAEAAPARVHDEAALGDVRRGLGVAHGYSSRLVQVWPWRLQRTRSCRRNCAPYQNSTMSGSTTKPPQCGGRGTSRPSYSFSQRATRCSKVSRSGSVCDCNEAQAPMWLPRARLAKYASDSSASSLRATPSTRTCTPWRRCFQWKRSEEHTSELQSHVNLVCRLLLEKKKKNKSYCHPRACTTRP